SIVDNECDFFSSICVSTSISFTDKVKKIIECDFEKKWKLSDISEEMNMSEVAVRKNLENENITFQQVLLDSKMNYAAKLILNSKNHINNVSKLI
ncbi:TPA: AraC family transcriptional regulator, partial [Escherichia coli]